MTPVHNADDHMITEDGFVYSLKYSRFLNGSVSKKGYLTYVLKFNDGKVKRMYAHRLVALTFLPRVEGKEIVNHIDGNVLNNHHSNLEWCTHGENNKHAREVLGHFSAFVKGKNHPNAKLTESDVKIIRELYKTGQYSQRALARRFNVAAPTILFIVHRRTWLHV